MVPNVFVGFIFVCFCFYGGVDEDGGNHSKVSRWTMSYSSSLVKSYTTGNISDPSLISGGGPSSLSLSNDGLESLRISAGGGMKPLRVKIEG
jgi:hypothetical protein